MADIKEITLNNSTYDIKAKSVVDQGGGSLKMWSGTQAQYDAIATKDATTLYNITDSSASMGSKDRVIGQLVHSILPLTDAGLHLLDGALIDGSGAYASFVQYIAGLVSSYPNLFVTEANWQASVTTYGVCGKFVYDNVNNTVRLPKITGIIEGTVDTTALGDLVEAGLPNITGQDALQWNGEYSGQVGNGFNRNGALAGARLSYGNVEAQFSSHGLIGTTTDYGIGFDASLSNSIYGNSSTVQPQTIKAFYYIVIANSTKTDIEVDIDEIATDLNGKADNTLSNLTNTGKTAIAHNAMPSNTYDNLTLAASGTGYIAPADGWFVLEKVAWDSGTSQVNPKYIEMVNNSNRFTDYDTANWQFACCCICPAKKGDDVYIGYDCIGTTLVFRFIYAVGSESEAQ